MPVSFAIPEKFLEKNIDTSPFPIPHSPKEKFEPVGCLYPYVESKKLKDGTEVLYPRILGKRDRNNPQHWRWGFNWKEKIDGVWKGKSIGSIPNGAVPMIREMQENAIALPLIIDFIDKAKKQAKIDPASLLPCPLSPAPGKPKLPNDAPIAIVLFSGGGGIEAGMVEAGIRPVVAVEYDPTKPKLSSAIADNHDQNFAEYGCKIIRQSVQEVADSGFIGFPRQPDYLHASPVCSNFSQANTGNSENAQDVSSAIAVAKAIRQLQPRVFTLENVAQYIDSESFQIILNALESLDYFVDYKVVNMALYGLPQARKRVILKASKDEFVFLPSKSGKPVGWYDAIAHLIPAMKNSKLLPKQQQAVEKYLTNNPPTPLLIERTGGRVTVKCKPGHLPCYTILRSHFTDQNGNNRNKFADIWLPVGEASRRDGTMKSLSIQAAAILQGFPDWYKFPNNAATSGSIIGYSVPPSFSRQLFAIAI